MVTVKVVEVPQPPVLEVQVTLSEEEARWLRKIALHDSTVPEVMGLARDQRAKVSYLLQELNRALGASGVSSVSGV